MIYNIIVIIKKTRKKQNRYERFINRFKFYHRQEAVKHIDGPLLILAGAGSGKTKTITTRLAYLIKEVGISPANTLTLTFTNKAAKEMEKRALSMIGDSKNYSKPMLCTFHKFGLIFLKKYINRLNRDIDLL